MIVVDKPVNTEKATKPAKPEDTAKPADSPRSPSGEEGGGSPVEVPESTSESGTTRVTRVEGCLYLSLPLLSHLL